MRAVIFGATGFMGRGVLRGCLLDPRVERVLAIGRRPTGATHAKLVVGGWAGRPAGGEDWWAGGRAGGRSGVGAGGRVCRAGSQQCATYF